MPILTDGRPFAPGASATMTIVLDILAIATWALLLCLVARRSKSSLTRDLFGVVVAVAALNVG